jgi:TRAP-type mannitol/chloroaromatic compound transport system substrate-binding protein
MAWRNAAATKKVVSRLYEARGVVGLFCGISAPHGDLWVKKPIAGVADLRGLKISAIGIYTDVFKLVGAAMNPLPTGEIVPAMDRGLIDAALSQDPVNDRLLGLPDVARGYMVGQLIGARGIDLIVNAEIWANLGDNGQRELTRVCDDSVKRMAAAAATLNKDAIRDMKQTVKMYKMPDAVMKALAQSWQEVRNKKAQESQDFSDLWATLEPFLVKGSRRPDMSLYGL